MGDLADSSLIIAVGLTADTEKVGDGFRREFILNTQLADAF